MSDRLKDILQFAGVLNEGMIQATKPKVKYPKGFEPGVLIDGDNITIVPEASKEKIVDWSPVLKSLNFDPEKFEVIEPVQARVWTSAVGEGQTEQMYYYKASVQAKGDKRKGPDNDAIIKIIDNYKPPKVFKKAKPKEDDAFIICLSDWQLGKKDGGGTEGTVKRILALKESVKTRVEELRTIGRPLGTLYVVGMGDLVENCDGHYAMQTFNVELNMRDQRQIAKRLVVELLLEWLPIFDEIYLVAVPGNHGEERRNGKAYTNFADNMDVEIFENVMDAFKLHPEKFGKVKYAIPNDERLDVNIEIAGHNYTFIHGHQLTKGSTIKQKIENWYSGQVKGKQPAMFADAIINGHYHHFEAAHDGELIWMMCPALEGGSDWFRNKAGVHAPSGTLTFRVSEGDVMTDLQILR